MKGRNRFTADEISQLKSCIRKKQSAPVGEQKRWRDKMRALGFYISDFPSGSEGFSDRDLDRLIERGAVEVIDQPSTGGPAKKAVEPKKESAAALSGGAGRVGPGNSSKAISKDSAWLTTHGDAQKSTAIPRAAKVVPGEPGLYAIFIDQAASLPEPFRSVLSTRKTRLIYVGKADNLSSRLIGQDLRHEQPSTFFRGIGAVLGYRPPVGSLRGKSNQNNYRFSATDTQGVIEWIDAHLSVNAVALSQGEPGRYEPEVIRQLTPLLNTAHNPEALRELAELRAECRRIAGG